MFEFLKRLNPYSHRAYIRELLALRAQRGPYRFSVKTWEGISDIDLALRVLQTEFFRSEIEPLPLPVDQVKSILVLAPHQDDEAIGAGGSLLMASKAGVRIDVLYMSDGMQRREGQPKDIGRIRDEEAQEACAMLGAHMHRLGISNLDPQPTLEDIDRLSEIIHTLKPQVIMSPWLLDWPSKHRLVNHLLWLAQERTGLPDFEVWGYQVHNTPFVNGYVDITDVAEEKRKLLECYRSQNNYRRYDHIAMGLAAWNMHLLGNTPDPKYVEAFFALPAREFFGLLESFYFSNLEVTYRKDPNVIRGAERIHAAVTQGNSKQDNSKQNKDKGSVSKSSFATILLLAYSLVDILFQIY